MKKLDNRAVGVFYIQYKTIQCKIDVKFKKKLPLLGITNLEIKLF